jgi:hypothetical protein
MPIRCLPATLSADGSMRMATAAMMCSWPRRAVSKTHAPRMPPAFPFMRTVGRSLRRRSISTEPTPTFHTTKTPRSMRSHGRGRSSGTIAAFSPTSPIWWREDICAENNSGRQARLFPQCRRLIDADQEGSATTGFEVPDKDEACSGGRTTFNRSRLGIAKAHALDAACVGEDGARVGWQQPTLAIKASARADNGRTKLTAHGFSRGYCLRAKSVRGFQAGDMMRAEVPTGNKAGTHLGRAAVRGSGSLRVGMPTESTPSTANFSIARAAVAAPGNPRVLPVLKNGV